MKKLILAAAAVATLAGCTTSHTQRDGAIDPFSIDRWATPDVVAQALGNQFLRLTLEAGTYEDGYIDAYYGPAEEKAEAEAERRSREELITEAQAMVGAIDVQLARPDFAARTPEPAYSPRRRLIALRGALVAAETRLRMIGGERLSFADEARGLFGVTVATRPLSEFDTGREGGGVQ
jgi:hypothetical protein